MKKIIAFLMCCSVIQSYNAQNYTPFPEKTAVWDIYIRYSEPDPFVNEYNRYTMEGDTIINNLSYNKIYCSHYKLIYPPPVQVQMTKLGYCFSIRQDIPNKKVYRTLTINNTTIDTLLYAYNLKIGDTVPTSFTTPKVIPSPQIVTAIDSISFHGKKYRRFLISGMIGASLIEGVGNANGLIEAHSGCFEGCYELSGFCDSEYHDCKQILVLNAGEERKSDRMQFFPNPFTDELTVQLKDESEGRMLVITDILGKEVRSMQVTGKQVIIYRGNLKSGMYFLRLSDRTGNYTQKIIVK